MPETPRIVALALLSQPQLESLGTGFRRWYAVGDAPCFGELLLAIDEADRALAREGAEMNPVRQHGTRSDRGFS